MACCGVCRPKVKPTRKTTKNITKKKMNTIDTWMGNIEGPYQSIILPSKSPHKPKITTNKEEIAEAERNHHLSDISISTEEVHDNRVVNRNMKSGIQNLQHLASDLSINEDIQSTMSVNK